MDPGSLTGALSFATANDSPGFKDIATVTFTTIGQVQAGGVVTLFMPYLSPNLYNQWDFEPRDDVTITFSAGHVRFWSL